MTGIGVFGVSLQTRGDQAQEALKLVDEIIEDMSKNGPTDDDIAFAKQQILSEFVTRVANNSSQLGYLGSIGFYDLPLDYVKTFQEKIRKVTADDVRDVIARYLHGKLSAHTLGSEIVPKAVLEAMSSEKAVVKSEE